LRVSFLIDEPSKFWISHLAATLASRSYQLRTLETHTKIGKTGVFSDSIGGVATFDGDVGVIQVRKENGQWTLEGDRDELEIYDLERGFCDEGLFADAVSC
jgi:hypothetical protein